MKDFKDPFALKITETIVSFLEQKPSVVKIKIILMIFFYDALIKLGFLYDILRFLEYSRYVKIRLYTYTITANFYKLNDVLYFETGSWFHDS